MHDHSGRAIGTPDSGADETLDSKASLRTSQRVTRVTAILWILLYRENVSNV